jgi:hypothetical protein
VIVDVEQDRISLLSATKKGAMRLVYNRRNPATL